MMEVRTIIADAHKQAILCLAWDTFRHKLFTGSEDCSIKMWDMESGALVRTMAGVHDGWVTSLLFLKKKRLLISGSLDAHVSVWSATLKRVAHYKVDSPVSCLAWEPNQKCLLVGAKQYIHLFRLNKRSTTGLLEPAKVINLQHDFVRCMLCTGGKIYVGCYDQYLRVFEPSGRNVTTIRAHTAGISAMCLNEGSYCCWLLLLAAAAVADFLNKHAKMWSAEGTAWMELAQQLPEKVTGLATNVQTGTLWITCNTPTPIVLDARTGLDVSEFISGLTPFNDEDDNISHNPYGARNFLLLESIPETNEIIGTTSYREVVIWRYNPHGPVTTLKGHTQSVECLAYSACTQQIYSGSGDATIRKWRDSKEQNPYVYKNEVMPAHSKAILKSIYYDPLDVLITTSVDKSIRIWSFTPLPKHNIRAMEFPSHLSSQKVTTLPRNPSPSATVPKHLSPVTLPRNLSPSPTHSPKSSPTTPHYLAAHFPQNSPPSVKSRKSPVSPNYNSSSLVVPLLAQSRAEVQSNLEEESIAPRVAGLNHLYVINEHTRRVTGLAPVHKGAQHFLISVSWDLSICVWNINSDSKNLVYKIEDAHKDFITDVAYSPTTDTFATSSVVEPRLNVWSFSTRKILFEMEGHTSEVSHVKWCSISETWISGSEDNTVRIWGPTGDPLFVLHCEGIITALTTDLSFGHLIVATDDTIIRVYSTTGKLLQVNHGHTDIINDIIHLPATRQYVSASWDKTVRIWHAYSESKIARLPQTQQVSYDGYAQRVMEETTQLGFADLHPLVLPKIMKSPIKPEYFANINLSEEGVVSPPPEDKVLVSETLVPGNLSKKLDELETQLRKREPLIGGYQQST